MRSQIGRFVGRFASEIRKAADMDQFMETYEPRWKNLLAANADVLDKIDPFRTRSDKEPGNEASDELFQAHIQLVLTLSPIVNDLRELFELEGYLREDKDVGYGDFTDYLEEAMSALGETVRDIRKYRERF